MIRALKRLSLGFFLLVVASAVLLVSDQRERSGRDQSKLKVALLQYATRPIMDESVKGVVDALSRQGFEPERSIELKKFNPENDLPTLNSMTKAIADGGFNMVITISTPCLQSMFRANQDSKMFHVFGAVTDPFASGVGLKREDPYCHPPHLVGIGTFQPVKESFRLAKQYNPDLKIVGEVWNPGETCSEACTRLAREISNELGITLLEATVDTSSAVGEAADSLVARGVQAIWIGGDNTVELAASALVNSANKGRIPVFGTAPGHAQMGALFGLGANYYQVGEIVGGLAADVLAGMDTTKFPIANRVPRKLAVRRDLLSHFPGWNIPDDAEKQAEQLSPDTSAKKRWQILLLATEAGDSEETEIGLRQGLASLGMKEGSDFDIQKRIAAEPELSTLSDESISGQADLIVVASASALRVVVQKLKKMPVLFTNVGTDSVPRPDGPAGEAPPNITGITIASNFSQMLQLLKEAMPEAKRIGTLFVSTENESGFQKDRLLGFAKEQGIELVAIPVVSADEVGDAALSLAQMDIDAIVQISDPLVNLAFPAIISAARSQQKPVFSFVAELVKKGGAGVSVSADLREAGRQLSAFAAKIMKGEVVASISQASLEKTIVTVHPENSHRLGLKLPRQVIANADEVIK